MGRSLSIALLLLGMLAGAGAVRAQVPQDEIPRNEDAELVFEQAVEAFEAEDFGMAYRRFRLAFEAYPLHRKTTAAHLMAGKALYRNGEYQAAADLLAAFIRQYPTSSYVGEAQRTLDFALQQLSQAEQAAQIITFGVMLPLGNEDAALTQALFNGIRLAVDEHNAAHPEGTRVRLVFRDSRGTAPEATRAVRELIAEEARVIIGPLYSPEARAAGAVAEDEGVVLIAPLATDEDVSEGKRYVFQANPTITLRGRQMAAYAMETLGLRSFGIVAGRDTESLSERMAEGFQQEVVFQGREVTFFELLENARGWSELDQRIGADTLARTQALYLPVSGGRAAAQIEAALQSLERTGTDIQVFGNDQWHGFTNRRLAGRFGATYTNDFYVDASRAEVRDFQARYRALAGTMPEAGTVHHRLAYTGYDLARFLIERLTGEPDASVAEALRAGPGYQGLGLRLDFREGNVNQALYIHQYRNGQVVLVR